ncbi:MAG: cellulase family glycosylhydrolase [Acidimicrobiales bacterium]
MALGCLLGLMPGPTIRAEAAPVTTPSVAGVSPESQIETLSGAPLANVLDSVAASKATWIRLDLFWPVVEPTPGVFDFSEPDPVVEGALARGLQVVLVADYTPHWAKAAGDPSAFAAFMTASARHYAPMGVQDWEIWNEPNLASNWAPVVSPTAYTATLEAAYSALKAGEPNAVVIAGALSPASDAADGSQLSPLSFLKGMYAAGAQGHFDALSVHPASFPDMPMTPDSWNTFYNLPQLHKEMVAHNDGARKIWLTEYGAPTGTSSEAVTEAMQGAMITQAYTAAAQWPWAGPVFTYWQDQGTDPNNWYDNVGIVRSDGSPKKAYFAFETAIGSPVGQWAPTSGGPLPESNPSPTVGPPALPAPVGGYPTQSGAPPPQATCSQLLPRLTVVGMALSSGSEGYWIASSSGEVAACGNAPRLGGKSSLASPVAAIAATADGGGYWLATQAGAVYPFGDAHDNGGLSGTALNKPIVAMAADPATGGYWLLGGDGGVFSFNAPFFGSTGNIRLNQPAVGMEATSDGAGYRFVAYDGGIFDYGAAAFHGSEGGQHLNQPVVGMANDAATGGYLLDARDGGIFSFDATFHGSLGGSPLNAPCVGMVASPDGGGYWIVESDGGVFSYGTTGFFGAAS